MCLKFKFIYTYRLKWALGLGIKELRIVIVKHSDKPILISIIQDGTKVQFHSIEAHFRSRRTHYVHCRNKC